MGVSPGELSPGMLGFAQQEEVGDRAGKMAQWIKVFAVTGQPDFNF